MQIGRFEKDNKIFFGYINNDKVYELDIKKINDAINIYNLNDLKILTPVEPSKIIAVGLNYKKHAKEMNMKIPDEPIIFLKPTSSVLSHNENIIYPDSSKQIDYEAELAVVIKNITHKIDVKEAKNYILGYMPFNDVTARDLQKIDGQWTRAKGFDTFSPFGPFIETEIENPQNLRISAFLNKDIMQDG